jgi:formyltetrahydrofolate-dependent phosphoribosylglycinamide formyltransferase
MVGGRGVTVRLAVLASGNGSNLGAILDAGAAGRLAASVEVVVSNRRTAFALERATAAGIPTGYLALRPYLDGGRSRRDYDADLAELVARHRPDWVVLAGWMHVLSMAFLGRFPGRVVNLHPALPGCFPGAHAIDDAWAAHQRGEIDRTGVMVHLVPDEGVDVGPVLSSVEVPILADDDRDALEARIHSAEHELLVTTLATLPATPGTPGPTTAPDALSIPDARGTTAGHDPARTPQHPATHRIPSPVPEAP